MNKRLLVEGNDDLHVISALCMRNELPDTFKITDCKGIEELKKTLPVQLKASVDAVGVILDADTDINARWTSIKNIVSEFGFHFPDEMPPEGLIINNDSEDCKFGLWIMPDNRLNGMLEDFIRFLIPPSDPLKPLVYETLDNLECRELNPYSLVHRSKAFIHTWLAWQERPGTPMGAAITQKYLTTDVDQCRQLINWLICLFSD